MAGRGRASALARTAARDERTLESVRYSHVHLVRAAMCLLLASFVLACDERAEPVSETGPHPALWQIENDQGRIEGWLFGTIHALPDDTVWRSPLLERTLDQADLLAVEVANLDDSTALSRSFAELAFDTPTGSIAERVDPDLRDEFDALLAESDVRRSDLDSMESWAAALSLSQIAQGSRTENGVDRSLLRQFDGKEVVELEGALSQLEIFDRLPEREQRDLLNAVLVEATEYDEGAGKLATSWQSGRLDQLSRFLLGGALADPELRQALLVDRNRAWAGQIENLLSAPARPFVAVGVGHMLDTDGLPALLERRGFTVRRIQ